MPSFHLGWNCAARTCAATGFLVGCGAGLVGAVPDKTLKGQRLGWLNLEINRSLWMRSTLVWIGLPSLLNSDAYFVFWITGASWVNGMRKNQKTLFSPFLFFGLLISCISFFRFWRKILWCLWIGRARHPGPPSNNLDVEVFNVAFASWCSLCLGSLLVWKEGTLVTLVLVWFVCVVPCLFALYCYSGFSEFFHLDRVLRCHLPVSEGRVIHLVVVYGEVEAH